MYLVPPIVNAAFGEPQMALAAITLIPPTARRSRPARRVKIVCAEPLCALDHRLGGAAEAV